MYQEMKFNLPALEGISAKQVEAHLSLYAGYVKNVNAIESELARLMEDTEKNAIELSELKRRYGFEWNGMRLHELYFSALGNASALDSGSPLTEALTKRYGSVESAVIQMKSMGVMRGIGWVLLVNDRAADMLQMIWVSDHEVGNLAGAEVLLAMDVWEHAYMVDYPPSGRKTYIEAFFKNLNWKTVESRFAKA